MNTLEMVQAVTKNLKGQGHKVNQEIVKATILEVENVVDGAVLAGDDVTVLGVKHSSKDVDGKEGVITIGSRAGETYKTEDRIVPTVKLMPSKKTQLTRAK